MPIAAATVVRRAADILQEATSGVRWRADELVRWLNDGQREIASHRDDATAATANFACAAGERQTVPTTALRLLDVRKTSAGRAVRGASMDEIDAQAPTWRTLAQTTAIRHWMQDERDERTFYTYPPASAGAVIEIVTVDVPTAIAEPAPSANYDTVVGNLSVRDVYANALVDYLVFRAMSKETEYADKQTAALHYGAFAQSIGLVVDTKTKTPRPEKP